MCFRPAAAATGGPIKCPKCGAQVPANADACPSCGATVGPGKPAAPGAPGAPGAPKPPGTPNTAPSSDV